MIYCLESNLFPTKELSIEQNSYLDENGFEWQIYRVENGFFIRYMGEQYFKEEYFSCDTSDGKHILIRNTNCIFINDIDFDSYMNVRTILKNGYTDEIWECFQELFEERFEHDKSVLESEIPRVKS